MFDFRRHNLEAKASPAFFKMRLAIVRLCLTYVTLMTLYLYISTEFMLGLPQVSSEVMLSLPFAVFFMVVSTSFFDRLIDRDVEIFLKEMERNDGRGG